MVALAAFASIAATNAQDNVETTVAADVVNQYIWRGQELGNVSLQPTLGVAYKGFSLTAWGNIGLSEPSDTKEFDLTAAYSVGGFNIGITDYWFNSPDEVFQPHLTLATLSMTLTRQAMSSKPTLATTSVLQPFSGIPTLLATTASTQMATVPILHT